MPFKSKKQEKWMWANKPELAKKWEKKYGSFKKVKRKVNNKLKDAYGVYDEKTKVIEINKKAHKKGGKLRHYKKNKDGSENLLNTIVHEELHAKHPKMHEKTVYKKAKKMAEKMTPKQARKLYSKYV